MVSEVITNLQAAYDKGIALDYRLGAMPDLLFDDGHVNFQLALEQTLYRASCHLSDFMNSVELGNDDMFYHEWNCTTDTIALNAFIDEAFKCYSAAIYGKMVYNA